jgi:Condensation domain
MATELTMTADTDRAAYWRQYLADPNVCNFPTLTDGFDEKTHRGRLPIEFAGSNPTSRFQEFSTQHRVTLHTIFITAWTLVLRSYTGSGAICTGSIIRADNHENVGIYSSSIEDGDAIQDIMQAVQRHSVKSAPHWARAFSDIPSFRGQDGRSLCNTALRFSATSEGQRDANEEVRVDHVFSLHRRHRLIWIPASLTSF